MKQALSILGLNDKQIQVFIYLVEYGISPASEIAKHVEIPKSSVNFLADTLWRKGYLKKSFGGKTGYFEIDVDHLQQYISANISQQQEALKSIIPELNDTLKFTHHKPKITFLEGVEACQNAYLQLLKQDIFYEFGAHEDLENTFGKKFMSRFISARVANGVFCDAIGSSDKIEEALMCMNKEHNRDLKIFDVDVYGRISSSIAIYQDKVMILNLNSMPTGVLIQNTQFAETMKTIYMMSKRQ